MTLLNFAIKSAFITGALTAGAFLTGATVGMLVNKDKVMDKVKKMQKFMELTLIKKHSLEKKILRLFMLTNMTQYQLKECGKKLDVKILI